MFKLLVLAAILALSLGSPVPKPSIGYTGTHLTPVITDYSAFPTVHAVHTYSSPLITYTGYHTPVLTHGTYGSPYYVKKYIY